MTVSSFAELGRKGIERFIQTVLVIDNELTLGPATAEAATPPVRQVLVPDGFRRNGRTTKGVPVIPPALAEAAMSPNLASEADAAHAEGAAAPGTDARTGLLSSTLDAQQIMDAFLRRSMICGMHRPAKGDGLVGEAIRAARRSDAVIVDWKLDGSDTKPARDIVAGILKGDADEQGRLRLIVVYTSEPDVGGVAEALRKHLGEHSFEPVGADPGLLRKADTRIVVLNKEGTTGGVKKVSVADLPERIIEEFAHLSAGVLGTFAVTAIAAVRRAVHHVLAIFAEDMDGAFLGHMCALKTPDDARDFALDLLGGELRSVASMDPDTTAVLEAANVALHIDTLADAGKIRLGNVEVPIALARDFPRRGADGVAESFSSQYDSIRKSQPTRANAITAKNVGFALGKDASSAEAAHRRFARFSCFKTELYDRVALPPLWRPTLMLGSLVMLAAGDELWKGGELLLCTQPRCDAVRLGAEGRVFPFQETYRTSDGKFNLVAAMPGRDGKPTTVPLHVDSKPHGTRMIHFQPRPGEDRILASKGGGDTFAFIEDNFEFSDVNGRRYVWIGDLRELTAQRVASMVAARLHEVGLDIYEWLRLRQ